LGEASLPLASYRATNRPAWADKLKAIPLGGSGDIELPYGGASEVFIVERLPIKTLPGDVLPDVSRFRGVPRRPQLQVEARMALQGSLFDLVFIEDSRILTSRDNFGSINLYHDLLETLLAEGPIANGQVPEAQGCTAVAAPPVPPFQPPIESAVPLPPPPPAPPRPPRVAQNLRTRTLIVATSPAYSYWERPLQFSVETFIWESLRTVNAAAGVFRRDANIELLPVISPRVIPSGDAAVAWRAAATDEARYAVLQPWLDNLLGANGYHIGHVFRQSTGGSVPPTAFGTACRPGRQVSGETGMEYRNHAHRVAALVHELSHQMNAHHSYNGPCGSSGGAVDAWRAGHDDAGAFEPGAGNTLMGFFGTCEAKPDRLAVLHEATVGEIIEHLDAACGTAPASPGASPVVSVPAAAVPVLAEAPFSLSVTVTDADSPPPVVRWTELRDTRVAAGMPPPAYTTRSGPAATFESPRTAWRGNLPSGAVTFVASARDRTGGYAVGRVQAQISSVATIEMQLPAMWKARIPVDVRWTPKGAVDPIYANARVRILLSTDGGKTFGSVLEPDARNTGSAQVCAPAAVPGGMAKLRIEAREGGFFVDSPAFSIAAAAAGAICPSS
jgi:hypothetical protein